MSITIILIRPYYYVDKFTMLKKVYAYTRFCEFGDLCGDNIS